MMNFAQRLQVTGKAKIRAWLLWRRLDPATFAALMTG